MMDESESGAVSAEQARVLLTQSESAERAARSEGRWVVTYLAAFGIAALVLIPLGAFVDRWPVAGAINIAWVLACVVLPIWASKHQVTPRGAGRRMGVAFLLFGLLYGTTAGVGLILFPHHVWWWVLGGIASAAPLLVAAVREARR